jgi:hypothetical protein
VLRLVRPAEPRTDRLELLVTLLNAKQRRPQPTYPGRRAPRSSAACAASAGSLATSCP